MGLWIDRESVRGRVRVMSMDVWKVVKVCVSVCVSVYFFLCLLM